MSELVVTAITGERIQKHDIIDWNLMDGKMYRSRPGMAKGGPAGIAMEDFEPDQKIVCDREGRGQWRLQDRGDAGQ